MSRTKAHEKISERGKQHVDIHRKFLLRKRLLRTALPGPAYVPFIGDGDIAEEMYLDRPVFGADLDPARVATARGRMSAGSNVRIGDCDLWPFPDVSANFAVADFDAYGNPYKSFRAFWDEADRMDRVVMFFTDGLPYTMLRGLYWHHPDGTRHKLPPHGDRVRSELYNFWLTKQVWPWFERYVRPYNVVDHFRYRRAHIVYWGAVVEK